MGNDQNSAEIVEQPNSCEISVNAKGDLAFKVKAYGPNLTLAAMDARAQYEVMTDWVAAKKAAPAETGTA